MFLININLHFFLGLCLLFSMYSRASDETIKDQENRGLEIAKLADKNNQGFVDSYSTLKMIIRSKYGQESIREMRSKIFELTDDGDKSLFVFDLPRDIKDTVFLSHSHKTGSDDQWLFLPALKRVKRISTSNKSGAFMGSEFAYEDMSPPELEKYTYEYLGDDSFDERNYHIVKRVPFDENSGYSYQKVWVDTQYYRVWKVEFYNRNQQLLKTLKMSDYVKHEDKYWRANTMNMENHLTGNSTALLFSEWSFNNNFKENDFDKNSMRNIR